MGTKPVAHQTTMCTSTYNKQYHTKTWGEQRVKYTTHNEGMKTRCVGKQDKTNGKWKMDWRWLEDRRRLPPNTARTRRGTDFGRSRDSNIFEIVTCWVFIIVQYFNDMFTLLSVIFDSIYTQWSVIRYTTPFKKIFISCRQWVLWPWLAI